VFFALSHDLQRNTWPTEDWELARSHVPTDLPEDDLFAGIRDRVATPARGLKVR
jgi:mycothiol S-conjugate amidase